MYNRSVKLAVMMAILLAVSAAFAASWPSVGPKRNVVTLVVCSNNKSPRLMAELIQAESKQPYLLLPAPQSNDTRIFFIPARGTAMELTHAKLAAFVRFLNPRRIVVLGNEAFVPRKYLSEFDPSIPLFIASCNDWQRIAEELTYLLNLSSLSKDYKRLRDEMLSDSRIYRPISRPQAKEQAQPLVEETVQPATDASAAAPVEEIPAAPTEEAAPAAPAAK